MFFTNDVAELLAGPLERFLFEVFRVVFFAAVGVNRLEVVFVFVDHLFFEDACAGCEAKELVGNLSCLLVMLRCFERGVIFNCGSVLFGLFHFCDAGDAELGGRRSINSMRCGGVLGLELVNLLVHLQFLMRFGLAARLRLEGGRCPLRGSVVNLLRVRWAFFDCCGS